MATCDMRHATCIKQHATCNMRHATCDMRHATCDMQHATCDMQHATCNMRAAAFVRWPVSLGIADDGNMRHATCDMQPATCNMQHATCHGQLPDDGAIKLDENIEASTHERGTLRHESKKAHAACAACRMLQHYVDGVTDVEGHDDEAEEADDDDGRGW